MKIKIIKIKQKFLIFCLLVLGTNKLYGMDSTAYTNYSKQMSELSNNSNDYIAKLTQLNTEKKNRLKKDLDEFIKLMVQNKAIDISKLINLMTEQQGLIEEQEEIIEEQGKAIEKMHPRLIAHIAEKKKHLENMRRQKKRLDSAENEAKALNNKNSRLKEKNKQLREDYKKQRILTIQANTKSREMMEEATKLREENILSQKGLVDVKKSIFFYRCLSGSLLVFLLASSYLLYINRKTIKFY